MFLLAPAFAFLASIGAADQLASRLVIAVTWSHLFWIFAVAIETQNWEKKRTHYFVWAGVFLAMAGSLVIPGISAIAGFWLSIAGIALSIQISGLLEKNWGARALHTFLILLWPLSLSLFANRLRATLDSVSQKRTARSS
jgi:hypothetical protein